MGGDATLPLQAAIVSAVKADPAMTALGVTTVQDSVPDRIADLSGALVSFGPMFSTPEDTHGTLGQETIVQIDVYSRQRGRVLVHQILDALNNLLHRSRLTVSGHDTVSGWRVLHRVVIDGDHVTCHGLSQFRFQTHE